MLFIDQNFGNTISKKKKKNPKNYGNSLTFVTYNITEFFFRFYRSEQKILTKSLNTFEVLH